MDYDHNVNYDHGHDASPKTFLALLAIAYVYSGSFFSSCLTFNLNHLRVGCC